MSFFQSERDAYMLDLESLVNNTLNGYEFADDDYKIYITFSKIYAKI